MNTYSLTWNPVRWPWKGLSELVERVATGKVVYNRWSCANGKVQPGDRLFLLKQGKGTRGIMASGYATSNVHIDEHYDEELAAQGEEKSYVDFRFDRLLDPVHEPLLSVVTLQQKIPSEPTKFTPRQSGILIQSFIAIRLETVWRRHLDGINFDIELAAFEGTQTTHFVVHRQRERALREAKIAQVKLRQQGRLCCEVPNCGFDFQAVYGRLGKDYAQVHHLTPLSQLAGATETSLADLIVVCANCHAMIHRDGKCRNPEELIKRRGR